MFEDFLEKNKKYAQRKLELSWKLKENKDICSLAAKSAKFLALAEAGRSKCDDKEPKTYTSVANT